MKEVDSLHPDRFEEEPLRNTVDTVVDRWLSDHFHGPHHVRALGDPYAYICASVNELKRRLKETTT